VKTIPALAMVMVVLMTTLIYSAQGASVSATDTAQSRISTLIGKLRSNEVIRVEIVQIPPRVLTRTRVTPEMLERSFHYKLIIQDLRGGAYGPSLVAAVASIAADPSAEMGDLRWGVTFFDQTEQRIESLYFDASGHRGAVDSLPVSFKGDMLRWLDDNFSKAFK
jgi:hypothetical protein